MTVTVSTLGNGLRVVTHRLPTVETVTLGVWVDAGTRDERPAENGLSHLLEHMAFKGTARRSARAIAEEIEAVGGHLNAHTSRENTAYYATVLKEDVPLALDIVADIVLNAAFDPAELKREQSVVLQEIGEATDTPDDVVFDHFQSAAFPDQPLGWPVLGDMDTVPALGRDALVAYRGIQYCAGRMVLAAAGNLDHDALVARVEALFARVPAGGGPARPPAAYGGGDAREHRDLEQLHLVLGLPGVGYHDPDYYPSVVMSSLFGGGMSSRLFQEVREERGLVYSVYSFVSSYVDTGLFGIYAGTGPEQAGELMDVLCAELRKLGEGVTPAEVARARNQLKAGLLMSLESTSARCEQLARQMLIYGRPIPMDEIVRRVEAVDEAAVAGVARRLIGGRPTVAAVGPTGGLADYEAIRTRLAA